MNAARVARLLRERARVTREAAELDEQLADAFAAGAGDEAANDAVPPPKSKPVRRRPRLPVVPPSVTVSDVDRAAARAHLRRNGYRETK